MGLIKYLLGSENRRNLRRLDSMSDKVLALEDKYKAMTDEQLKAMTAEFKNRLKNGETLEDILYDAFAVVREAAWRVLNMRHYKVQVMGGICLHQGRVARRNAPRVSQCAYGAGRAHRYGQRLPCQARRRMDGQDL